MFNRSKLLSILVLAGGLCATASASELLYLNVQMVQVCDDSGAHCADPSRQDFAALTNQIWAQADIEVNFLPWEELDSTASYSGNQIGSEFNQFPLGPLTPLANIAYIYMLPDVTFHADFPTCQSCVGQEYLGVPSAHHSLGTLSDFVVGPTDATSAADYLAHQLGIALGLQHNTTDLLNLMRPSLSAGATSIDVAAGLDDLDADQINLARSSALLTRQPIIVSPEPAAALLLALPLAALIYRRRRA